MMVKKCRKTTRATATGTFLGPGDRNWESALTAKVYQFFMSTSAYTHSYAYVNVSACPPISASSSEYPACFFCVCFSFFSPTPCPCHIPTTHRHPPPLFVWVRRLPPFRFLLMAQITTHNFHITSAHLDVCVCALLSCLSVCLCVLSFFCSSGMRLFVAVWRWLMWRYGNQYS